jgi:hypothetical protein
LNINQNATTNVTNASSAAQNGTYDYIVVGSGLGGGPLAARPAIAGFKVLLIDAGNDQGPSYQEEVPSLWPLSTQVMNLQILFVLLYGNCKARALFKLN